MSLLDLILEQKIIVITVIAALIPLFVAAAFMVQKSLRRILRQRAQQRIARAAAQAALAATAIAEAEAEQDAMLQHSATIEAAPEVVEAEPDAVAENLVQALSETSDDEKPGQDTPAEIQSLLTSVFTDEGQDERLGVLLRNTQAIDIVELAQLCSDIAHRLHASAE